MFLMLLIAVVTSNVCGYFPHPYLFKCITPKPTLPANTCRPCGEVNKTNECAKVTDYCCYKGFWLEHTECPKNCTTPKPTVFPKCKLCSKSDKCASMRYVCDDGQWKIKYTCPSTCRTPKPIAIPKICRRCSNEKCASISYVCQSGKWVNRMIMIGT